MKCYSPPSASKLTEFMLVALPDLQPQARPRVKHKHFMKWVITIIGLFTALFLSLAHAQTNLAGWDFEPDPLATSLTNATFGPLATDNGGTGTLTGVHAATNTVWSSPIGNGSSNALSANNWAIGDYFQFQASSLAYSNISLAWSQTRSSTGPTNWSLRYSTDGVSFTAFTNYSVAATTWNATNASQASVFTVSLATVTALDNQANVYLRLVSEEATAPAGSARIDDVTITALPLATGPTIYAAASLSPFSTFAGTASASQQFAVTGTLLTTNNAVAAPSGFEVSTNNISFATSATVPQIGGEASGPMFVRIAASAPEGPLSGNVTLNSDGATAVNVAVIGTVSAASAPMLSTSGTLTPFSTVLGTASAAQTFTVAGSNLTTDVTVSAPSSFEVATDSVTFGPTATLPQSGGTASGTISARLAASAPAGSPSGNITVASTGATTVNVAASGTVTAPILSVALSPTTVAENAGAGASTGTITASIAPATNLTVTLISGSPANATVPASVVIASNTTVQTFPIDAVPNPSAFTNVPVLITASAVGYTNGAATLTVSNTDVAPITQISLTSTNTNSYTQDFNSLGTVTISNVISPTNGAQTSLGAIASTNLNGWYAAKISGTGTALLPLSANDGSSISGGVYSYGSTNTAGGTDLNRSLGLLASGGFIGGYGAMVKNDTTNTLTGLNFTFTAKFWRSSTSVQNVLTFGYGKVDGTTVTVSNFIATTNGVTPLPGMNIVGPLPVATAAALDGNNPTNQAQFSNVLVPVTLAPGESAFIRWQDANDSGNDAGLAIDDLSLSAVIDPLVAPEFSVPSGTYLTSQTVFVPNYATYGPGVEVRYTLDGNTPDGTSALYNDATGIVIADGNGTKVLKAIALNPGQSLASSVATATYSLPQNVADLAALRASPTGTTVYRVTGEATFTAGTSFRNTKFFQTTNAGIQIDDPTGIVTTVYAAGDNVQNFLGRLSVFSGQLQMTPIQNFGAPVSTGNTVTPLARTLTSVTNADQAMLVTIKDVTFENAGGVFGAGGSTTPIKDPTLAGFTGVFQNIFGESNVTGATIPGGPNTLTGIVQSRLVNAVVSLTVGPRNLSDIVFTGIPALSIQANKLTLNAGGTGETEEAIVQIRRVGATDANLVVDLTQDVAGAFGADTDGSLNYLPLPSTVTIPIGSSAVLIYVVALPNSANFTATLTASASGFDPASQAFSILGSGGNAYDTWASGFGLDPATTGAPTADPDGDSFNNAQEYAFGTNPTQGTGSLLSTTASGGNLVVTWLQRSDVTYNVQSTANLATTAFASDGAVIVVDGPVSPTPPAGYTRKQITVSASGQKFYRVTGTTP